MFGKLFGWATTAATPALYAITNESQAPKTDHLQLSLCARVDSNHHPVYTGQGPQPDAGGVDRSAGVQIAQFAGVAGRIGRVWRGGCSQSVLTGSKSCRRDRWSAPEWLLASCYMPPSKRSSSSRPSVGNAQPRGRTQAVFYRDTRGHEPVDAFLEDLLRTQPLAVAKIDDAIEEHLNGRDPRDPPPEFPATSQIEGELRELRVRFARTRYRVLYQRSRNLLVLLHIFEKNTGTVSAGDRRKAEARMVDFRARMDGIPRRRPRAAGRDAPPGAHGS